MKNVCVHVNTCMQAHVCVSVSVESDRERGWGVFFLFFSLGVGSGEEILTGLGKTGSPARHLASLAFVQVG